MSTGARYQDPERLEQAERLRAARFAQGHKTGKAGWAHIKRGLKEPMSYNSYAQYENGRLSIVNVAGELAEAYDVPLEWLLKGQNPPAWSIGDPLSEEERLGGAYHYLRAWRLAAEMSEEALAEAIGATVEQIQRWERGEGTLSDHTLRRLAKALRTTAGMILDVDPGAVPPNAMREWLKVVQGQAVTVRSVAQIRGEKAASGG